MLRRKNGTSTRREKTIHRGKVGMQLKIMSHEMRTIGPYLLPVFKMNRGHTCAWEIRSPHWGHIPFSLESLFSTEITAHTSPMIEEKNEWTCDFFPFRKFPTEIKVELHSILDSIDIPQTNSHVICITKGLLRKTVEPKGENLNM